MWVLGPGLRSCSSFIFTLRDTNDTDSFHYRSFEEGLVGIDSIWTRFVNVLEKSKFLIFWQKLGGPLTRGEGGQPFSGRNSLTDHKQKLLTFPNLVLGRLWLCLLVRQSGSLQNRTTSLTDLKSPKLLPWHEVSLSSISPTHFNLSAILFW